MFAIDLVQFVLKDADSSRQSINVELGYLFSRKMRS